MARRDWYCEDVLSGKLEVTKVWEDERVLAFRHPQPTSEIHVVVIPKHHVASLLEKLDAVSRTDAVAHAARLGVINL